ncbi:MAG: UTP--glucose-1-phosphate uridylyltransferase GalU [Methanobrevibacter sp.]|uniref:UTP--glucose-1-phosphate uridylyltransferase GalU n=1 Tax=Methanobrevibacter sp. TaxID=66852 RepID=UPI002E789196|nr:UTP--glucose-1-phosphate uridylyltransferase GalU [Methanobrevibacter sp.]MEE0935626.1 UTP--glucose-1-phosphate uridylyltransferase GalU [Methanobrevibacter sp.]
MKAVIPAAGLGTRLLPATKAQPKEMLPVYDKPTIQYVIEEALASGIDDILIVTGRNKRSIENHFDKSYELEYALQKAGKDRVLKQVRKITDLADVCYVRQRNLKGLGDAISCAERHIGDEPFAVLLGDSITTSETPLTKQLIDVFNQYDKSTIAIRQVTPDRVSRHGIVSGSAITDNVYKIDHLVEKPNVDEAPSDLAIVGRYILTPDIFDKISQTEPGFNGEIQLTDALSKMDELYGVKFDGDVFNIENRLEWLKSSINFAMHDDEFRDDLINYMKTFI